MKTILAITSSTKSTIRLIGCETREKALELMKDTYDKLCDHVDYDYYNTFFDEESGYAQVVSGLEQTEFRIGKLSVT